MTTNISKPRDSITPEEADRLASHIRPSWEIDEGDEADGDAFAHAGPATTTEGAPISDGTSRNPVVAASPAGAPTSIPHDTVVDSGPPGKTNPPNSNQDASVTGSSVATASLAIASQPPAALGAPKAAQATRVGLGDEVNDNVAGPAIVSARIVSIGDTPEAPAIASAAPAPLAATTLASSPPAAFPVAPQVAQQVSEPPARPASDAPPRPIPSDPPPQKPLSLPPRRAVSVSDAPPQPSTPPQAFTAADQASFSRADDPIDIPVQRTSRALLFAIAGVVVLGAIVGGVALMNGSDTKTDAKSTSSPTAEAQKPADTAKPAATDTAKAQVATATAAATATVAAPPDTATATAAPTTTPTTTPTSKPDAPQKSADAGKPKNSGGSSSGQTSGQSGGSKKPPKTGGGTGIIRDAPF